MAYYLNIINPTCSFLRYPLVFQTIIEQHFSGTPFAKIRWGIGTC